MCNFESGAVRERLFEKDGPVRGSLFGERFAIGRMHDAKRVGTDLVRKKWDCRWCLNAESL